MKQCVLDLMTVQTDLWLMISIAQVAYASWSKAALKEAEALSLRHRRLPECNGVLELSVIEALDLHVNPSGLHG